MFELIKKMSMELLISTGNASYHTKCVSLGNQKCMTQPTLTNLHLNEYSQECHYYSFSVKLEKCGGSCSALDDYIIKCLFQITHKI